jgi:hypothetical protein
VLAIAKEKLKAGFIKFCVIFTICAFVGAPLGAAALKAAGVRGNIEFPAIVIGGGTDKEAQAEQTATRYASALPSSAVTPPPGKLPAAATDAPLPDHKPTASK